MQLFYFLVVIISLSCGSLPATEVAPVLSLLTTLAMVGTWCCLCHLGSHVVAKQVRDEGVSHLAGAQWIERQLEAFRWLSLGVILLCLWGFGVAGALSAIPVVAGSMFLQAIVLLAPGMIMVAATWSAEHHYGVYLDYCDKGLGGYVRSITSTFRSGLAWLVVPVILLLGMVDMIGLLPVPAESAGVVAIVLAAVLVPIALPKLIQHLFQTSPIDGETGQWIDSILTAAGVRGIKTVRWDTDGRAFNAVVAGFFRPFRTLMVSDRLLDELPKDQIAMVLLHEAAHLRRYHVPLRIVAVLPAWVIATLVSSAFGDVSWGMTLGTAVGILMTMLMLRLVAYRSEFDADIQACRLAERIHGACEDVPDSYFHASDALSKALLRVTAENPHARRATWLHPGVADRVRSMRRQRAAPISSTTSAGTIANPA